MKEENELFETKLRAKMSESIRELEEEGFKNPGVVMKVKNNENKKKWRNKSHFIKVYNDMFDLIDKFKLDAYELATILKLMNYVEYETNLISYSDGKALNKKDLVDVLGHSENKIDRIMRHLVEKKVLAKTKVGRKVIYHINPNIVFRGVFLSSETESIFRNLD